MPDPILSPSEKKRLAQDEKTEMAMAAVFCRGHHTFALKEKNSAPNAQRLSTTPWSEHDAAPISTAEPATPAPPNAIDLPCGKKSRKSWPTVDLG